jgi:putative PEP-CTERM system TPR-repeat lipoprotein
MLLCHSLKTAWVCVLFVLLVAGCGGEAELQASLDRGRAAFDRAEYASAIVDLKNVLKQQPGHAQARQLLGRTYLALGSLADAEKELIEARKLGQTDDSIIPDLVKALLKQGKFQDVIDLAFPETGLAPATLATLHSARAMAFHALGNAASAQVALTMAGVADAAHPDLLLTRSALALSRGDRQEAARLIESALAKQGDFIDGLYMKAILKREAGQQAAAMEIYRRIIELNPREFVAYVSIATMRQQAGDLEAAAEIIAAAEKHAPNVAMVRYARANIEFLRGRLREAHTASQQLIRIVPEHQASQLLHARISFALGDYEQSRKMAQAIINQRADHLEAGKILAASLLKFNETEAALAVLRVLVAAHGEDVRLLGLLGETHLARRDYAKAMAYLRTAAAKEPTNPAIKTIKARGHQALGQMQQAYADMEQAASLTPDAGSAHQALASLYVENKSYDQALKVLSAWEKQSPANPLIHNLRAQAMSGKGDSVAARKALEKALSIDPNFLPAVLSLARLEQRENKLDEARKHLAGALQRQPDYQPAMLALADLAAQEKNFDDYVKWLERANQVGRGSLAARTKLIRHYLDTRNHSAALELAQEGYRRDPKNPEVLLLLGRTQLATGNDIAAMDTFTLLVGASPHLPEAHHGMARAQLAARRPTSARASLERALELRPDFVAALDSLIQLDLAEGRRREAIAGARRMQALESIGSLGYRREAEILLGDGRYAEAVVAYRKALDLGGGSEVFVLMHRVLVESGAFAQADAELAEWLGKYAQDNRVRLGAAESYMRAGENRRAIALFEAVLRAAPNQAAALNNLANLYQREKDPRALDTAERALKLASDNPYLQDTLGWILLEQGQLPRALELLRRASEAAPNAGTLRYHFAVALSRANNREAARIELRAATALGNTFPEYDQALALLRDSD